MNTRRAHSALRMNKGSLDTADIKHPVVDKEYLQQKEADERFRNVIELENLKERFDDLPEWLDVSEPQRRSISVDEYAIIIAGAVVMKGRLDTYDIEEYARWLAPIIVEEVTKRGLVVRRKGGGVPTIYLREDVDE